MIMHVFFPWDQKKRYLYRCSRRRNPCGLYGCMGVSTRFVHGGRVARPVHANASTSEGDAGRSNWVNPASLLTAKRKKMARKTGLLQFHTHAGSIAQLLD